MEKETESKVELKMKLVRAERERDTAFAARDRSLREQVDLTIANRECARELQLLRRESADLQGWSANLGMENELQRAQLAEMQGQWGSSSGHHYDAPPPPPAVSA